MVSKEGQYVSIYPKAENGLEETYHVMKGTKFPNVSIYPKAENGLEGSSSGPLQRGTYVSIYPKAENGLEAGAEAGTLETQKSFNLPEGRDGFKRECIIGLTI